MPTFPSWPATTFHGTLWGLSSSPQPLEYCLQCQYRLRGSTKLGSGSSHSTTQPEGGCWILWRPLLAGWPVPTNPGGMLSAGLSIGGPSLSLWRSLNPSITFINLITIFLTPVTSFLSQGSILVSSASCHLGNFFPLLSHIISLPLSTAFLFSSLSSTMMLEPKLFQCHSQKGASPSSLKTFSYVSWEIQVLGCQAPSMSHSRKKQAPNWETRRSSLRSFF